MAFEQYILPESENGPKMSISTFLALIGEYIRGELTSTQVKTYIEQCLSSNQPSAVTMDANSESDIDALLASIDAAATLTDKLVIILAYRDVFDIAENHRINLYKTRAELRTRLGFADPI